MARIYDHLIGVPMYCDAIDAASNHSPFVPIANLKDPELLKSATASDIRDLAVEGFFLIDPSGRVLDSPGGSVAFVIAPHVAQREAGGRFPEQFDRKKGSRCGFGGPRATKIPATSAPNVVACAWVAWKHS